MDQIGFYNYLLRQGVEKKVCSDHVSRLKRIEKALKNCVWGVVKGRDFFF